MTLTSCEFIDPFVVSEKLFEKRRAKNELYKYITDFLEVNTPFTINDFNEFQLTQLALCALQQIDIFDIADPKFSDKEIFNFRIRKILEELKKKYKFIDINDNIIKKLIKSSLDRNYLKEK